MTARMNLNRNAWSSAKAALTIVIDHVDLSRRARTAGCQLDQLSFDK